MNLTFDYLYDASLPATDLNNLYAARVNAWYVGNVVHDLTWKYGFRPLTFNFQADTIQDKWARGEDPVLIKVQTMLSSPPLLSKCLCLTTSSMITNPHSAAASLGFSNSTSGTRAA